MRRAALLVLTFTVALTSAPVRVPGLQKEVEILRDRWGVPHIYAATQHDLFFAQGYITAVDRLFQIDLWRRAGTGRLAEILGPSAVARDQLARAVNFHGDWSAEWAAYGTDTRSIVTAFTDGINAYVRGLNGKLPADFAYAGYAPGLWTPEDCLSRVAGLMMTHNLTKEVQRALDIQRRGLEAAARSIRLEPAVPLTVPAGLDLSSITSDILSAYRQTTGAVRLTSEPLAAGQTAAERSGKAPSSAPRESDADDVSVEQGSNNWVVDGTMTATGRPMLANDPHRPVQLPSLRKTVHLVGPGWNAIGSGEPALPGIALGHNEAVAFGFTIVGIDQQDLYVETVNPENAAEYRYRGTWRKFETERQKVGVKGEGERAITLKFSVHGPVIYEDAARRRAYVLRWVGSEPGTAGYMAGLALARAKNWTDFRAAMAKYKVPSENVVYADVKGNIGWQVGGLTPVREGWNGLLPVPGESGRYEWKGYRKSDELPMEFNPARHWIATANHNILPAGYKIELGYDSWSATGRIDRIREMLSAPGKKFDVADFVRMQQDVTSLAARRFVGMLKGWTPSRGAQYVEEMRQWDGALRADSRPALIYEVWSGGLAGGDITVAQLQSALDAALDRIERTLGKDPAQWQWGKMHQLALSHPTGNRAWGLGPVARPGDATTVNATSGAGLRQTNGASWREVIDVGDWDRSVMTNVPGESGDPASKHYGDLLGDWAAGRYHAMVYSRKAVEAAMEERIVLRP